MRAISETTYAGTATIITRGLKIEDDADHARNNLVTRAINSNSVRREIKRDWRQL